MKWFSFDCFVVFILISYEVWCYDVIFFASCLFWCHSKRATLHQKQYSLKAICLFCLFLQLCTTQIYIIIIGQGKRKKKKQPFVIVCFRARLWHIWSSFDIFTPDFHSSWHTKRFLYFCWWGRVTLQNHVTIISKKKKEKKNK